ncbi:thiol-disulfide oxidoreductase DCC family protein [Undibacterium sp. Di24W]|uniref:thiol-disulfide oxidoreductase DCC family protein n=1 Tax=Undibacterium sp. Di24W TaxID=3413033 RepID=UPI003BF414BB
MTNLHPNTEKVCTIYFDGACPVCAKEIATYRNWQGAERIDWIDASRCTDLALGTQLERAQALAKLHARDENGMLVSGAAAFVMMWRQMPALKWITSFLDHAWIIRVLDYLYEAFLKIRPLWRKADQ